MFETTRKTSFEKALAALAETFRSRMFAVCKVDLFNDFALRYILLRLRVVSNFGDGDCGAGEIHTRALGSPRNFARPTVAIAKIRDYLQLTSCSLKLKSLTTLVVENLFAEMRQGKEMPLVLQFAHRFSSAVREYIKRISQSSFRYYTSSSSHYSKQVRVCTICSIPFNAETL